MTVPFVEVERLSHRYVRREGTLLVLDEVSFEIGSGSYVSLVGRSGSGKSTLFAVLGGLEPPQSGRVTVNGTDIGALAGNELADYRRRSIGFIFQHFGLLEACTALENVELALALGGVAHARRRPRATELLGDLGLAGRLSHRPHELSGGERQRVAIARAIANDPGLILADEPTGNLDVEAAESVAELLQSLRSERGCTVLVVTHNPVMAAHADIHLSLHGGRLAEVESAA
jgi:putative ABC transport system ATP-binding protein